MVMGPEQSVFEIEPAPSEWNSCADAVPAEPSQVSSSPPICTAPVLESKTATPTTRGVPACAEPVPNSATPKASKTVAEVSLFMSFPPPRTSYSNTSLTHSNEPDRKHTSPRTLGGITTKLDQGPVTEMPRTFPQYRANCTLRPMGKSRGLRLNVVNVTTRCRDGATFCREIGRYGQCRSTENSRLTGLRAGRLRFGTRGAAALRTHSRCLRGTAHAGGARAPSRRRGSAPALAA